jgi:hypothetical protein
MSKPRTALLAALLAAVTAATVPAAYAEVQPSPIALPGVAVSPPPSVDAAARDVKKQQSALATETAQLANAAAVATTTLQAYQQARRDAADAAAAEVAATARAEAAKVVAAQARAELQTYAGSLYRFGPVDERLVILTATLTSREPEQFFSGIDMARQVGVRRGRVLETMRAAEAQEATAAADAKTAAATQARATRQAAAASAAADKAVKAYSARVAARRAAFVKSTGILLVAVSRDRAIRRAERIAEAAGWRETPPCAGGDVTGFDNGRLPLDALCPVRYTTAHRLRADAAEGFNKMAVEYAATFGVPICVTDSYRSFDAQVAVAAEKPDLAAHPGRSNHGWGIAADLCGGIESFDTPMHQWMLDNAPLFGWFHPAWAEPTGSRPEAWHWEFSG